MTWIIAAGVSGVLFVTFVYVVRPFTRGAHAGPRGEPESFLPAPMTAPGDLIDPTRWDTGSMTLAEERAFDGQPPWARPEMDRYAGYGWASGSCGSDYGPGEFDEWLPAPPEEMPLITVPRLGEYIRHPISPPEVAERIPWVPLLPVTRLADTGDVMDARLAADVAAYQRAQDADARAFSAAGWDECRSYLRGLAVAL